MFRPRNLSIASALAFSVIAIQAAHAAPPAIDSAAVVGTTLTINGSNLLGGTVTVVLGSTTLPAPTTNTASKIVVTTPAGLLGTYGLTVTRKPGGSASGAVTIGAVGPQGPKGDPGTGMLVVDSNGATVGTFVGAMPNGDSGWYVFRQVAGTLVSFKVPLYLNPTFSGPGISFLDTSIGNVAFFHATTDCSGPRYYPAWDLVQEGLIHGGQLYFGTGPIQQINIVSIETFSAPQGPDLPGTCDLLGGPGVYPMRNTATVDLGSLGLVPPFRVRDQPTTSLDDQHPAQSRGAFFGGDAS